MECCCCCCLLFVYWIKISKRRRQRVIGRHNQKKKKKEVFSIAMMMISSYKWYLQKTHYLYIWKNKKKKQPIKIMMMFGYANWCVSHCLFFVFIFAVLFDSSGRSFPEKWAGLSIISKIIAKRCGLNPIGFLFRFH